MHSQILLFQVEFADDLYFTGIEIYETLNAGAITRISAWDPSNNKWVTVWESPASQLIQHSRCFSPPITVGWERNCMKGNQEFCLYQALWLFLFVIELIMLLTFAIFTEKWNTHKQPLANCQDPIKLWTNFKAAFD